MLFSPRLKKEEKNQWHRSLEYDVNNLGTKFFVHLWWIPEVPIMLMVNIFE